jgi:hypothetical protein
MLLLLFACMEGSTPPTSVEIPTEAYEWSCYDYQEYSEVEITAAVCNDFEALTVSITLVNDGYVEERMYHEGGCWWNSTIQQEENCIEIQELFIVGEINGR